MFCVIYCDINIFLTVDYSQKSSENPAQRRSCRCVHRGKSNNAASSTVYFFIEVPSVTTCPFLVHSTVSQARIYMHVFVFIFLFHERLLQDISSMVYNHQELETPLTSILRRRDE